MQSFILVNANRSCLFFFVCLFDWVGFFLAEVTVREEGAWSLWHPEWSCKAHKISLDYWHLERKWKGAFWIMVPFLEVVFNLFDTFIDDLSEQLIL